MNWFKISIITLLSIVVLLIATDMLMAKASEAETDAYKKAYALGGEEEWEEALTALQAFMGNYPDSIYADDAGYWFCHANEHISDSLEKSVECFESFVEKHPKSKWNNAAKSKVVSIAKKLIKHGKHEYNAQLKSYQGNGNVEIAIQAIHALGHRYGEASAKKLKQIYDKKDNFAVRKAVIFALSQNDHKSALEYLYQIATSDNDIKSQLEAVFWLGQRDEKEAAGYLEKIVFGDYSYIVLKKAVLSISQLDNGATDLLIKVAKNHSNAEVRMEAVFWISQADEPSDSAVAFLDELIFKSNDSKLQNKAVFALSQIESPAAVKALIKIVKTHTSTDVRKQAIFWLGQSDDPSAVDALTDIIDSL